MSTFLIKIVASSNLAEVLAADNAALETNSAVLAQNTSALQANSAASKSGRGGRGKKVATEIAEELTYWERRTEQLKANAKGWMSLKGAQEQVGYTVMGISFRVGQWFVPAMGMMLTSIIPVIVALLAMASAAVLAGGALVGVFALGALAYMRKQGKNPMGGYGGARRPFDSNGSQGYASLSTIFEPVWKVLESPKLKNQMENATWFFKATIGSFADGLGKFLSEIDPGMLKTLENMFLNWLPKGMQQLARWGNSMVRLIGAGTIQRLGNLISWIARGLMNSAVWLENGGWDEIDKITKSLDDMCSVLMDLGKSALPVFTSALAAIWPKPLKPILEAVTALFLTIANNPDIKNTFIIMTQFLLTVAALKAVLVIGAAIAGSWAAVLTILGLIVVFIGKMLEPEISQFVATTLSIFKYLFSQVYDFCLDLIRRIPGYGDYGQEDIDKFSAMTWEAAKNGDYAPGWSTEWRDQWKGKTYRDVAGGFDKSFEIYLRGDDQHVEKIITDGIGEKTGTFRTPSSNMRSNQRVRL